MQSNTREPLGLPTGSVRGILAIALVVTACLMGLIALVYGCISGAIADPTAIVLAIIGLAQLALGSYFVVKAATR